MKHITGSCFCGAITYEADIDENRVAICHCRDCQIFSGSAFRTVGPAKHGAFKITRGTPKEFEKTADSGRVRRMQFCGVCGTHLASVPDPEKEPNGTISIRIASADQFNDLIPVAEVYCSSQTSWTPAIEGTRRFQRMPTVG